MSFNTKLKKKHPKRSCPIQIVHALLDQDPLSIHVDCKWKGVKCNYRVLKIIQPVISGQRTP